MNHQPILRAITNTPLIGSNGISRTGENTPTNNPCPTVGTTPSTPAVVRRQREKHLRDKLRDESAKNDDLYSQVTQLQSELNEKNKKISCLNEKISDLRSQLNQSVDQAIHDAIVLQNKKLSSKVESLQQHEKIIRELKAEVEQENSEMREQLESLSKQVIEVEKLRIQLKESNEEKELLVQEIKNAFEKLKATENVCKEQVETLMVNYEEKIAYLNEKLESMEPCHNFSGSFLLPTDTQGETQQQQDQPESLGFFHELRANDLSRENDQLKIQLESVSEQLRCLQSQMDTQKAEFENLVSELKSEKSELQEQNSSLQISIIELTSTLARKENDLNSCQTKFDELLTDRKSLKCQVEAYQEQVSSLSDQMALFKQQTDQKSLQLEAYEAEIECYRDRIKSYENEIVQLEQRLSSMQGQLNDRLEMIKNQGEQIHELWDRVLESETTSNSLGAQLEKANSQVREKSDELDAKILQIDSLNGKLKESEDKIRQLQNEYYELVEQNHVLTLKSTEKDSKIEELIDERSKLQISHQNSLKNLQTSYHEMNILVEKVQGRNVANKEQIEKLQDELAALQSENESLKANNEKLSRCKVDESEVSQLNDKLNQALALLEEKEKQMYNLKCDLDLTEESFQAERATKNRYSREIARLETLLKEQKELNSRNTQIIVPTTINVHSSDVHKGVAIAEQVQQNLVLAATNKLNDSQTFKKPFPLTGRDSVALNNSTSSLGSLWTSHQSSANSTRGSEYFTAYEDEDRLSVLQNRNRKQPLHLKSSYAAELQNLPSDENVIKAIAKGKPATLPPKVSQSNLDQTFTLTETTTTTTTTREVKLTSNVENATKLIKKGISPGSRSVFRRAIMAPKSWSPGQRKPTNEIPY